jgi:serine protease
MNRSLSLLVAASTLAAACAPATPSFVRADAAVDLSTITADTAVSDRVVACFSDDDAQDAVLSAHPELSVDGRVVGCTILSGAADAVGLTRELRDTDGVTMAEPELFAQLSSLSIPNDPGYDRQWHMDTVGAPDAWALGATGEGVVVAVIDSGIDMGGVDTPALVAGYDFIDGDADPTDDGGGASHGTHVAGTVAQPADNGQGGVGVAPDARVMPVRVCDDGGCPNAALAQGIEFAVDHGADVINMSLGGFRRDATTRAAIDYANANGVVVIAASGNGGQDGPLDYPATYEGVISVGATDAVDGRAPYSNAGPRLDLVAPGGDCAYNVLMHGYSMPQAIDANEDGMADCVVQEARMVASLSQSVNGDEAGPVEGYGLVGMNGTSMAAPHVAGAAALLVGMGVPADRVEGILKRSAADLGEEGRDDVFGSGLLDAAAAVERARLEMSLVGAQVR